MPTTSVRQPISLLKRSSGYVERSLDQWAAGKAYDVRGTYPDQMDDDLAYRSRRAFPRVLSQLEDVPRGHVGWGGRSDIRLSAPA
jgi:hypothetical protein